MEIKLTFVNVGYGEAILLECPDDRFPDGTFVMLIDGGSALPEEFADSASGRVPLAEYLAERRLRRINLMVSTHIHEDHLCGLLQAAKRSPPAVLWQTLPSSLYRTVLRPVELSLARTASQRNFLRSLNDWQELGRLMEETGGTVEALRAGASGQLCEGLRYQVLAPNEEKAQEQENLCQALFTEPDPDTFLEKLSELDARMNNYSLILLLEYRGTRILLPGDTNCLGYDAIDPAALSADLFKVGHHGQRDGASRELRDAVHPKVVVCCASSDRRYDSAHPDTLRMLAESGADLYFSDCPELPGLEIPPHRALTFTVGENGKLSAQYVQ